MADLERIDPDRLGDVLELGRAEIANRQIKPPLDLPIGSSERQIAWAWRSLQARAILTPSPMRSPSRLLDDVAEMDADAELDATLQPARRVAFDHAVLHFDRAAHGVDHAAELCDERRRLCA